MLHSRCVTHINNEHIDTAENRDIIMIMYNLIVYSNNYADTSGSLWQFRKDEQNMNNYGHPVNATTDSTSFKYKSSLSGYLAINGTLRNANIVVPLRYLSKFFGSLEMPMMNQLTIKSKNMMKLKRLQKDKDMITQQDFC